MQSTKNTQQINPKSKIELQTPHPGGEKLTCVILSVGENQLGLLADELADEQEIVLKQQSALLRHVRNVVGSAILGTGEVCMVLNPQDIIKSARKLKETVTLTKPANDERKKSVLLAEDSIITRTQEKRILEEAGYEVVAAVDGLDAYNKLGARTFDALVSDIMMPNMDGLELTRKIRGEKKYQELPIILVTSLASDDDKRKGIEAGANAYIPKLAFDQKALLDILKRLA